MILNSIQTPDPNWLCCNILAKFVLSVDEYVVIILGFEEAFCGLNDVQEVSPTLPAVPFRGKHCSEYL